MTRKKTANSKNGGNGLTRKSLSFYKKRTCWYAEVPEHTEAQNQMVSGADMMCETMACGHKRVTIDFLYGEEYKPSSVKCLACLDKIGQTAYGATYRLSSESGGVPLPDTAWLCNVTKTVCGGNHPTHIYITDVRPNDEPPYGRTKGREILAKMEKKVGSSAGRSDSLAKMLESDGNGNGESEVGEPIYTNDELQRLLFAECKKNPDFTKANDDFYYTAIDLDSKEEEIKAAASRLANIISPISRPFIERRWKGYDEEYRKYVENGEVGNPPDPFSESYNLPIFDCFKYLT